MKTNILTKKEFVKAINAMRDMYDFQMDMIAIGNKYNMETPICDDLSGYLIDTLDRMFELERDDAIGSDISYFCYELNFGRDWDDKSYVVKIGDKTESIDISDAEKLYDWLTRDLE